MARWFYGLLLICSVAVLLSVYLSPLHVPLAGLLSLGIPLLLIGHGLLLLLLSLSRSRWFWVPLLVLVLSFPYLKATFRWPSPDRYQETRSEETLEVLSYNVHLFRYNREKRDPAEFRESIVRWLSEHPADIKCIQEFYQDETTASTHMIRRLAEDQDMYISYQPVQGRRERQSIGMAIISRFPIINEGRVFDNARNNGVIFADVRWKNDTIRIYNVHLESMSIQAEALKDVEGFKENYYDVARKIRNGQVTRASQLEQLQRHIADSPYPVLLMGDFNDTPYSYLYFNLRQNLANAFESAGSGFGFTYNRVLFFLRIDHLFYLEDFFDVVDFKTYSAVDYSDHYPIGALLRKRSDTP
ncbi:MAG: endonuclease/exonuclease/phosphatase family protein [Nitritalea sp.]